IRAPWRPGQAPDVAIKSAQVFFLTTPAEDLHEWGSCHRSSRVSFVELHPWPGRGSRAPTRSSRDYAMRAFRLVMIAAVLACATSAIAGDDIAPGGTLRAAYLGTNPPQPIPHPA